MTGRAKPIPADLRVVGPRAGPGLGDPVITGPDDLGQAAATGRGRRGRHLRWLTRPAWSPAWS